ncbi:hypothetical protein OC498_08715 [Acinetobacter bohemicus]|uniref:hypothetical protein n=1 Tax=Acinetobacter TaxID=469 RepID=UPI00209AF59A|nr:MULTISPECIES: hypothetical protein [Acinetobacter]MCO8042625.1 hypothetical protein [Acinetobacter sp. S4400-12]MCU7224985.1 hypothetical protein [Acinetobacter bohemicus]
MEIYKDIDNDSNVTHYEIGETYIRVKFNGTAKIYTYSYRSAGVDKVERMKQLAKEGNGLNAYIKLNTNSLYEK